MRAAAAPVVRPGGRWTVPRIIIKEKPNWVAAYNKYMGGVNISDRKIYHVSDERPSRRYWKKIFFKLLNRYELYRRNTDAGQRERITTSC